MSKKKNAEQDMIDILQKYCDDNPDKTLSRDAFRKAHPDVDYASIFGTWTAFVRAANLTTSREHEKILRQIAVSKEQEKFERINKEKLSFEDKFVKHPNAKVIRTLVISDVHDLLHDAFTVRCFIDSVKKTDPHYIILNGDIFDFPELSKHFVHPNDFMMLERVKWVHEKFLEPIRNAAPDAQITLLEGNHEFRLFKYLTTQPQAMVLLEGLHGMSISDLLCLNRYEINLLAKADLRANTEADENREIAKNYWTLKTNGYSVLAFQHLKAGPMHQRLPGANGHHHKHMVTSKFFPNIGSGEWHQLGCAHKRDASYTEGEQWSNGFLFCETDRDSGYTSMSYADTSGVIARVLGTPYRRKQSEIIV